MTERRGSRLLNIGLTLALASAGCSSVEEDKASFAPETPRPTHSPSFPLETFPSLSPEPSMIPSQSPDSSTTPEPSKSPEQFIGNPNVVLLPLDDFPEVDDTFLSLFPNLKSVFVDQGINFKRFYGEDPLCCPGRGNILTGEYSHNSGVIRNDATLFDPRETIATKLQDEGFYTFISGKYFNYSNRLSDKSPMGWGNAAIMSGGMYNFDAWINGKHEYHAGEDQDYSTDVFGKKALDFLRNAPADKPVFAYITPYAPHSAEDQNGKTDRTQTVPAPRHKNDPACQDIPRYNPANFNEADVSDKPSWIQKLHPLDSYYSGGFPMENVCRALLSVDEHLGNIINELKSQGRYENTIFILTADNGMGWGSHRWLTKSSPHTTQVPLRISWPQVLGQTHSENNMLLTNVDLAPTICEIAGCKMGPYPNGKQSPDGQSFAGLIAPGLFTSIPERDAIILEDRGGSARVTDWRSILTSENHPLGSWQYVEYATGEKELYDISGGLCLDWQSGMPGDPCELENLASQANNASILRQLSSQLASMW